MRTHVTFLLNGEITTVRDVAPTTTLLTWLRRQRRLAGTKEGCAEGDCGACSVVVGRLVGGQLRHRVVNACILFLPMLEGQAVTTVERIGTPGDLHPCQAAMVELHGSQCGFCTPGFVMALYAAYLNEPEKPDPDRLADFIAGNLCRCTGYGPILAAGAAMYDRPRPAADAQRLAVDVAGLRAITHNEVVALDHAEQRFFAPVTLDDLLSLLAAHPGATLVSGATDVGLWVTKQHRRLDPVIWTGRVRALQTISQTSDTLTIGAGVTYADAHAVLAHHWPDFGELVRRIGAEQVRASGTIGGNIANGSPIGDTPPALIALGATLVLQSARGTRRLPLDEFFLAYRRQDRMPDEIVRAIEVPRATRSDQFSCYTVSKRFDQDISSVCGAFNIAVDDGHVTAARIAFGGLAATPKRARAVEARLAGRPWTLETVQDAAQAFAADFQPISDQRASAAYRLAVARNLLLRVFHEWRLPRRATRIAGADGRRLTMSGGATCRT